MLRMEPDLAGLPAKAGASAANGENVMVKFISVAAVVLVSTLGVSSVTYAAGGSSSGASGASSSTSSASVGSTAPGSGSAPTSGTSSVSGSQPMPGKRKAVEDGLRRTGNAPSPSEDKQQLQSLNQISRQVAPGVPVPAPEVNR